MTDQEKIKPGEKVTELPKELIKPLTRLWKNRQKINVRMLPRDAYMLAALLQFADRNPALTEEQHDLLYKYATELIIGVTQIEPALGPYLQMGWDSSYDQPSKQKEK